MHHQKTCACWRNGSVPAPCARCYVRMLGAKECSHKGYSSRERHGAVPALQTSDWYMILDEKNEPTENTIMHHQTTRACSENWFGVSSMCLLLCTNAQCKECPHKEYSSKERTGAVPALQTSNWYMILDIKNEPTKNTNMHHQRTRVCLETWFGASSKYLRHSDETKP